MKPIFIFTLLLLSSHCFSFDYNLKMIEHRGGVVSQLNNCGVQYSSDGRYLWGIKQRSPYLQTDHKTVVEFYSVNNGILSRASDNKVYFSPNGKNISGGGMTRYLGTASSIFSSGNTAVLMNKKSELKIRTKVYSTEIKTITNIGTSKEKTLKNTISGSGYTFLGFVNGKYYVKRSYSGGTASIFTTTDPSLKGKKTNIHSAKYKTTLLGGRVPQKKLTNENQVKQANDVQKIIPYQGGVLVYSKNWVVVDAQGKNLIPDSNAKTIYNGRKSISSILQIGGIKSSRGKELGLLTAFVDGDVFWSKDGKNLAGGGSTKKHMGPVNVEDIAFNLDYFVKSVGGITPSGYKDRINFVKDIDMTILNKGDSKEVSKFKIAGNGSIYAGATVLAMDLSGQGSTVNVYNKGWNGFEYKWRYKGKQTGFIDHNYKLNYLGKTGIKFKAINRCTIVGGIEYGADSIKPVPVVKYKIDSHLNVTDNSNNPNPWWSFAEGSIGFEDVYSIQRSADRPKNLGELLILLTTYDFRNHLKDSQGKRPQGVPIHEW